MDRMVSIYACVFASRSISALFSAAILASIFLANHGVSAMSERPDPSADFLTIVDPSLSSDGELLLFSFSVEGRMHRLGQLNLVTDELKIFFDLNIE